MAAKKKAKKKAAAKKPAAVMLVKESAETCTTNTDAMAHILGLSKDAIRKHLRENDAPRIATGKLSLIEFIHWYVNRIRDGESDTKLEKHRLAVVQRKKAELEIMQKRGELYGKNIVHEIINELAGIVSTRLDSLPARVAGQAVIIDDSAEMRDYLLNETRSIRSEIARSLESFAGDLGGVEDS